MLRGIYHEKINQGCNTDSGSKWLLIDLKDVVVHLFVNEERQVYNLDRLYSDVPVKTYDL